MAKNQGGGNKGGGKGGGGGGNQPKQQTGQGGKATRQQNRLPGVKGKDFKVVSYGNKTYVVYGVKTPAGTVKMSWKVGKGDFQNLGIKPGEGGKITKNQFKSLNFFGSASEIILGGEEKHPFKKFLSDLQETFGDVSWLNDKEYMTTVLMGHLEQKDEAVIQQMLSQTQWYQKQTKWQRDWEMVKTKKEKNAVLDQTNSSIREQLDSIYGPTVQYGQHITDVEIQTWADQIASGKLGDPNDAFGSWAYTQTLRARNIEGTNAWMDWQGQQQQLAEFQAQPELMYEQLRGQALEWLGPQGLPDDGTLRDWARRIATGQSGEGGAQGANVVTEADWMNYLRTQSRNLYPFLGTDQPWMDFASPYKRMVEELWGSPVDWTHSIFRDLANPEDRSQAMDFGSWERRARSSSEFWKGDTARQESSSLLNYLNSVFSGVS